jgi:hypothetical protein
MAILPFDPAYASLHAQTIRAIRQGTVQDMRAVIEQWQRVEQDVPHARQVLPLLSEGLVDDQSSQNMQ